MKRFFCTICGDVKRVRRLPGNIDLQVEPLVRKGECVWHNSNVPRVVRPRRASYTPQPKTDSPKKKKKRQEQATT